MKCSECGKEVSPYSRKCTNCGHEITTQKVKLTKYEKKYQEKKEKKKRRHIVTSVVIGGITICLLVVSVLLFRRTHSIGVKSEDFYYWNKDDLMAFSFNTHVKTQLEKRGEESVMYSASHPAGWGMKYQTTKDRSKFVYSTVYTASMLSYYRETHTRQYTLYYTERNKRQEPICIKRNVKKWFLCGAEGVAYEARDDNVGMASTNYYYSFATQTSTKLPCSNIVAVNEEGNQILFQGESSIGIIDVATLQITKEFAKEETKKVFYSKNFDWISYLTKAKEVYTVECQEKVTCIAKDVYDMIVNLDTEVPIIYYLEEAPVSVTYYDMVEDPYKETDAKLQQPKGQDDRNAKKEYEEKQRRDKIRERLQVDGLYFELRNLYSYQEGVRTLLLKDVEHFSEQLENGEFVPCCDQKSVVFSEETINWNKSVDEACEEAIPKHPYGVMSSRYFFNSTKTKEIQLLGLYNAYNPKNQTFCFTDGVDLEVISVGEETFATEEKRIRNVRGIKNIEFLHGNDLLVDMGENGVVFYNEQRQKKVISNYKNNTFFYDVTNDCYYLLVYEKNESVLYRLKQGLILEKVVEDVKQYWVNGTGFLITLEGETVYYYDLAGKRELVDDKVKSLVDYIE